MRCSLRESWERQVRQRWRKNNGTNSILYCMMLVLKCWWCQQFHITLPCQVLKQLLMLNSLEWTAVPLRQKSMEYVIANPRSFSIAATPRVGMWWNYISKFEIKTYLVIGTNRILYSCNQTDQSVMKILHSKPKYCLLDCQAKNTWDIIKWILHDMIFAM